MYFENVVLIRLLAICMAFGAAGSAGDPGGVFIATREPPNGTRWHSGREPLVSMMEPADLWKRHDLSAAAGLSRSPLGGVLAQRKMRSGSVVIFEVRN